jgi:hypothetical protein
MVPVGTPGPGSPEARSIIQEACALWQEQFCHKIDKKERN